MEMDSAQAGAQPAMEAFDAAMDRRFERKEKWKNRLGNRYAAEEIQGSAGKFSRSSEEWVPSSTKAGGDRANAW